MGSLANFDHGGRYSAYLPAAQGFGQMVGPTFLPPPGANLGYSGSLHFVPRYTPSADGFAIPSLKKAVPRHGRGNLKV